MLNATAGASELQGLLNIVKNPGEMQKAVDEYNKAKTEAEAATAKLEKARRDLTKAENLDQALKEVEALKREADEYYRSKVEQGNNEAEVIINNAKVKSEALLKTGIAQRVSADEMKKEIQVLHDQAAAHEKQAKAELEKAVNIRKGAEQLDATIKADKKAIQELARRLGLNG